MMASPKPYKEVLSDGSATVSLILEGDEYDHYERDLNGTSK